MADYSDSPEHDRREADLKIESLEQLLGDITNTVRVLDMLIRTGALKGATLDVDALQNMNDDLIAHIIDLNNERKRSG